MFTFRQLILAVIISSANIIFADILIPPGYDHQHSNNPSHPQYHSVPLYKIPAEQYAKQLAAQRSNQHLSEVQIVHPYYVPEKVYQDKVRSNLVGYPHHSRYHYPYRHYMPRRPTGNLHYVKLGGHKYVEPSIFIAQPKPLAVHHRRKRSTDFTNVKSSKPAIATHDVATKPSLIDTKYPIVIDSLLPEKESTNTNDKHVKNRSNDFATKSFLFDLDPNKMYSGLQAKNLDEKKDETQHSVSKRQHATLITPVILTQKLTPDPAKATVTEPAPTQRTLSTSQEKGQNQEPSRINHENPHLTPNVPSTNSEQSSSPITTSQMQSSEEESHEDYNHSKYYLPMISMPYYPTIPFAYNYWPQYITYNAEVHPSKKKKYPDQQNQISSQETTNIGATNIVQPKQEEFTTRNIETKKPPSEAVSSMPTTTPAPCYTYTQYRNNEEPTRSDIISAPNPGTSQAFYTIPDDYTNYYLNYYPKDNLMETDYQDYNYDDKPTYDYDDKPTYLTDGFHIYVKKNSAYSSNVSPNKIRDNMLYGNINARSNVNAPMTYVVSTSSDIPQKQEQLLGSYYYPKRAKKMYVTYKPQRYNYYKHYDDTIDSSYQNVPKVFYRPFSSPVYY